MECSGGRGEVGWEVGAAEWQCTAAAAWREGVQGAGQPATQHGRPAASKRGQARGTRRADVQAEPCAARDDAERQAPLSARPSRQLPGKLDSAEPHAGPARAAAAGLRPQHEQKHAAEAVKTLIRTLELALTTSPLSSMRFRAMLTCSRGGRARTLSSGAAQMLALRTAQGRRTTQGGVE